MKIPFILNGDPVIIDSEPDEKLIDILRDQRLFSVKCGCSSGSCGSCTILLDDKPVPACILVAAAVRDCSLMTLEGFQKTPEYKDINFGFTQAGVHLCGYCNSGKIFAVHQLISRELRPSKEQIIPVMKEFPCKCVDSDILVNGVIIAAAARRKRLAGKKDGK